ncbi:MAG: ABC transporter substrate-binding protein [Deltaproteobacteria bacterium]|nr:ABC transporter substrate-binding protein [Deltaproteobacteria bacterium]
MRTGRKILVVFAIFSLLLMLNLPKALAANAKYDAAGLPDMSDFDPSNPIIPTGDTIKIAIVASFSGPAAIVGEIYFISVQWAAHDINKRGGILVDGKRKKIQVIRADTQSKPAVAKKVCERMILKEHVNVLWGTNGSHIMKVINQVAKKYGVIAQCAAALSDELYDARNFTRYSFMTSFQTNQIGRAAAYYYGQIRKKEKKFYILCQDYLFGHSMAEGFKEGLKLYYPQAQLVGEDYHKLFLTDFAPYLTKIKASGAEVVYTGDWIPDAANLLVQARQAGIKLPFANIFLDEPNFLHKVGVEGTKGLLNISQFGAPNPLFKNDLQIKFYKAWNDLWKTKWKAPFNTYLFKHPLGNIGSYMFQTYWLLSVIERAGSLDPEKIIKQWEGDSYEYISGKVMTMRPVDHKAIQDLHAFEYVPPAEQKQSFNIPPYSYFTGCSNTGPISTIPAEKIMPKLDPKLKR